jgi:hypothetical protein
MENEQSDPAKEPPNQATRTEYADIICRVHREQKGGLCLLFEGQTLPSLGTVYFGFDLSPGTTREQADILAAEITRHCPKLFAIFIDISRTAANQGLVIPHP